MISSVLGIAVWCVFVSIIDRIPVINVIFYAILSLGIAMLGDHGILMRVVMFAVGFWIIVPLQVMLATFIGDLILMGLVWLGIGGLYKFTKSGRKEKAFRLDSMNLAPPPVPVKNGYGEVVGYVEDGRMR